MNRLYTHITAIIILTASNCFAADIDLIGPLKSVIKNKTLEVCMVDKELPPFIAKKPATSSEDDYIDLKLINTIKRELERLADGDVKLEFVKVKAFNDVVTEVSKNPNMIGVSKLSSTISRSAQVIFSEPYLQLGMGLLVNNAYLAKSEYTSSISKFIWQLKQTKKPLNDKGQEFEFFIGVIKNSSYQSYANQWFGEKNVKPFDSWDDAIEGVKNGEAHALFRDEFEIKKVMASHPELPLNFKNVVLVDRLDNLAIAINEDSLLLKIWIDQILKRHIKRINPKQYMADYLKTIKPVAH